MKCDKYKDLIFDHLMGEIDPEDKEEMLKHLSECAECQEEYRRLEKITAALSPDNKIELSPIEKLKLENRLYKEKLKSNSTSSTGYSLKRVAVIAAALLFFVLGFSSRGYYDKSFDIENNTQSDMKIEEPLNRNYDLASGSRISKNGFLLITKGKKALKSIK